MSALPTYYEKDIINDPRFNPQRVVNLKKYFITELGVNSYAVLNQVEDFTRSLQAMGNLLRDSYSFLWDILPKYPIESMMSDIEESRQEKKFAEILNNFNKQIVSSIQVILESSSLTNKFNNCLSGEFLIFDFKGQTNSETETRVDVYIEQLYLSLQEKIADQVNIIYQIGLIGNKASTHQADFVHAGLLIVTKRGQHYSFLRYDPWGNISYNGEYQFGHDYNNYFRNICSSVVKKLGGNQPPNYIEPQNLGVDIQTPIENLNITKSDGLCMNISTYIGYMLFKFFEANKNANYTEIQNHIKNLCNYIVDDINRTSEYNRNIIYSGDTKISETETVFRNFSSIMTTLFNEYIIFKSKTIEAENKSHLQGKMIDTINQVNTEDFAVSNDPTLTSLNYICSQTGNPNILHNTLATDSYDKLLLNFEETDKYANNLPAPIVNNLLLGLRNFKVVHNWEKQKIIINEEIQSGFYKQNSYKDFFQHCDELNLCKKDLICHQDEKNVYSDEISNFNKKINLGDTKICIPDPQKRSFFLRRTEYNEEEKRQKQFYNDVETGANQNINSDNNILTYINQISRTSEPGRTICSLDKRFIPFITKIEKYHNGFIGNINNLNNDCKTVFKYIIHNIEKFKDNTNVIAFGILIITIIKLLRN